ncbi:hypothetical protein [Pengzhenrongella sicca]|uniref:DUF3137 domain-containing protein n=1 Tax=Pengzhenrongella sicca TaxID=2819238 RepID=A0A8A4ZFC5_9MICO|nr:hypothetical protein [Pengzhenrongella sicca]QTE29623.1 hypothetical protein J4E96_00705 [Pengzhenrongella sicca]
MPQLLMDGVALLVGVVFVALIAAAVAAIVISGRRQKARLLAWTAQTGWSLRASAPELTERWTGEPFGIGSGRRATNVLTGTWQGRPAMAMQYMYTTRSGKQTTRHIREVVVLTLPAFLPTLELRPEDLGTRLVKAFGGQDIEFESEDFNRAWRVTSRSPKFAHDVVHPQLMERLLRPGAEANLRIEGLDILTWRTGRLDVDRLATRLGLLGAVVGTIPRFVWLDHGYDPMTSTSPEGEK